MIAASLKDIARADPQGILAEMMEMEFVGRVPVLALDTGDLPGPDKIIQHIKYKIGNRPHADELREVVELHQSRIETQIEDDREEYGTVDSFFVYSKPEGWLPACKTGPHAYKPMTAALVFLAPENDTPEKMLRCVFQLSRGVSDPLLPGNTGWRLADLFHECTHINGAEEPQADYGATLRCRQVMPESPIPLIRADIRAIETVLCATAIAAGRAAPRHELLEILTKYGWSMVEAGDAALDPSQEEVMVMTEEDILKCVFKPYDDPMALTLAFGKIAKKETALIQSLFSHKMTDVVAGAGSLLRTIGDFTQDSKLHAMAQRFYDGARRLTEEAGAYAKPQARQSAPEPVFAR